MAQVLTFSQPVLTVACEHLIDLVDRVFERHHPEQSCEPTRPSLPQVNLGNRVFSYCRTA